MTLRGLLRWAVIIILVTPLGLCTSIAALNYSGYCFDQSRYLTDDERIRSGIDAVLGNYAMIRFVPGEMPKRGSLAPTHRNFRGANWKGVEIAKEQLVPYRDLDEFTALNPDCCSFGRRGLYTDVSDTPFLMKLTGSSAGFFNARYQIRYRDAAGQIQSRSTGTTYHYTNCGRSNLPYQ